MSAEQDFIRDVAAQTPEKPDYWSSCGQCQHNSERAQDLLEIADESAKPVDMVLFCPACGVQHIDGPEWVEDPHDIEQGQMRAWNNPPHRSHICHHCKFVWRPADVPTNGVASVKTKGRADSEPAPVATKEAVSDFITQDEVVSALIDQWYFNSDIHDKAKLLRFARAVISECGTSKEAVTQVRLEVCAMAGCPVAKDLTSAAKEAVTLSDGNEKVKGLDVSDLFADRETVMRIFDFYKRYAIGSLAAPSCLVCGQSTQDVDVAIKHLELPDIVVCANCHSSTHDRREDIRDTERLNFMLENDAFTVACNRDGSILQYQLMTQDEDENYHLLHNDRRFYNTEREAIDAAILAQRDASKAGEGSGA